MAAVMPAEEHQPARPAARPVGAAAVLLVALVAAAILPDRPLGLGVTVVALAAAAAVWLAAPITLERADRLLVGLGVGLALVPAVRAAEWIAGLCLLAGMGMSALVVTRAVAWREVFAAPLRVIRRIPDAARFVVRPILPRVGPVKAAPAIRGAAIAVVLVVVFGALFVSADRAFAQLVQDLLLPEWDLGLLPFRIITFVVVLFAAGALARMAVTPGGPGVLVADPRQSLGTTEWTVALVVLNVLFAAFVAVQITVLFGGRAHVLSTSGLSYAEYAREGFFQLLAVGALTLAVVAAAVRWARRRPGADTRRLQLLLGLLSVLTLIVLASAFRRLTLYESVFGATRLRLSVHASILWMAVVFGMVLVAGVRMRASWLPRAVVVLSALTLLAVAALNPDRFIAQQNVELFQATGSIDLTYLAGLSPDAVPVLADLPPDLASCAMWRHAYLGARPLEDPIARAAQLDERSLAAWNYGRRHAAEFIPLGQVASPHAACQEAAEQGVWP